MFSISYIEATTSTARVKWGSIAQNRETNNLIGTKRNILFFISYFLVNLIMLSLIKNEFQNSSFILQTRPLDAVAKSMEGWWWNEPRPRSSIGCK